MRIDKYISASGIASRKECARAARAGQITVNGTAVRDVSAHIDENTAEVFFCGKKVRHKKYTYIMLNKPAGFVSTTDPSPRSVMALLPKEYSSMNMFPCGRLDMDTVGLLLITNNGPLAHELLSPRHHVEKTYFFRCDPPIDESQAQKLRQGVDIGDCVTRPARLTHSGGEGEITLTEGKYHQIKRMFESVGSKITYLKRISFGSLTLDGSLEEGQWRELTEAEEAQLTEKTQKQ